MCHAFMPVYLYLLCYGYVNSTRRGFVVWLSTLFVCRALCLCSGSIVCCLYSSVDCAVEPVEGSYLA